MVSGVPPKGTDARREPGFDDDELPTDIIHRETGVSKVPKLRLGTSSSPPAAGESVEPTVLIKRGSGAPLATAALPRELRAWFEVKGGPLQSLGKIDVTSVRIVIGRGAQADLRIEDASLSRKHAVVFYTGEEFRIRDENSGNGTLLNGSRVVEYALRDGDELGVGQSVLVFHATGGR